MKSVILGAIILLFACVFIARAADADDLVSQYGLSAGALANCWAYDADGFDYPQPRETKCFERPSEAKAAALASCKKHSERKDTCHIVTCGWCGSDLQ